MNIQFLNGLFNFKNEWSVENKKYKNEQKNRIFSNIKINESRIV